MPFDLTDKKFGRLIVKGVATERNKRGRLQWKCECDCGNIAYIVTSSLTRNGTQSCGCLRREWLADRNKRKPFPPKYEGNQAAQNRLYGVYTRTAKIKGYDFTIDKQTFLTLTSQKCNYCGTMPKRECKSYRSGFSYFYNGLDRVDNTKGYTEDNVVTCCLTCNKAKGTMTLLEFKQWIKDLIEHNG